MAVNPKPKSASAPPKAKPKPRGPVSAGAKVPSTRRRSAPPDLRATVRVLYLRALGIVLVAAFASLGWQLDGLIGVEGLLPATEFLQAVEEAYPAWPGRLAVAPTLAWFLPPVWGPALLVVAGLIGALGPLTGRYVAPGLLLAWISYVSLTVVGQRFLGFQWDALICEATLASVVVAPWGREPTRAAPVAGWWLLRALTFKVVFFGGLVKLWSGDASWRDLTALTYHFETQPLPNGISAWAHHLPDGLLMAGTGATLLVELVLVWGIFGPASARRAAWLSTSLLMVGLAATGNYGIFQVLTLVLALSLLTDDDLTWARLPTLHARPMPLPWARHLASAALLVWTAASGLVLAPRYVGPLPEPAQEVAQVLAATRSVNPYGLFAVMTRERPLPVLEARWGEGDWQELTWRWQTSDPSRAPAQVAPHMPRLDWQLWFAGLGTCEQNPWLVRLQERLLEGSEPVARLIGDLRLVGGQPPTSVRVVAWNYSFAEDGAETPWVREPLGTYCPELTTDPR